MVDEKKHSETEMGEPVSAREKTAQNADEVAMGRPTAPKDIDARSDAQIARRRLILTQSSKTVRCLTSGGVCCRR